MSFLKPQKLHQPVDEQFRLMLLNVYCKDFGYSTIYSEKYNQKFRESGDIPVDKGTWLKLYMEHQRSSGPQARPHQKQTRSVMEVAAYASERFQKSLSVNTVNRHIHKCILSGSKLIQNGLKQSWELFCGGKNQNLKPFFGNHGHRILKGEVTIQPVSSVLHLWWYGNALVLIKLATFTSGEAPSMLKGIYRF